MFKICLEDVDELHAISLELGILTYLQGLVQYDGEIGICEPDLAFTQKSVDGYLWDKQLETVLKLRQLLAKSFAEL